MIAEEWRAGEVGVIGLGKSGLGAATLLSREGCRVYASDASVSAEVAEVADRLRAIGVSVDVGNHDLARIQRCAALVVSPGVPPSAPPILAAKAAGAAVLSEVELALSLLGNSRIIAVTGTNGKTTTTALVGHLLRSLGYVAVDAGNIGTPLSEVAMQSERPAWIALEMSSFQLHDTPSLNPTVGVLTNLSPDHLDRYASVADYYADKAQLFRNDRPDSQWVVNQDDPESMGLVESLSGSLQRFSLRRSDVEAFYHRADDSLVVLGNHVAKRGELALLGDHNVANALAAALAVTVADPLHASSEMQVRLANGLRTFRSLPHRLEPVAELNGVLWINDSKATNVSSTLMALRAMQRPTILLLGGKHKGESYAALREDIAKGCKLVIAYGAAAETIERDLTGAAPLRRIKGGSTFRDVVEAARSAASSGEVVLLAPACASYDMFRNYEERGNMFKDIVAMNGGAV